MEIVPGLHRLEMPLGNRVMYQHIFAGTRTVVVDTGIRETPETLLFPYLRSIGRDPSTIDLTLISHADADHFGGNEAIKKAAPGTWIACHRFDASWVADPERIMAERYNQFAATHGMSYPDEVKTFLRQMMGGPVPVDMKLSGGEVFLLSPDRPLRVLFLPGHTRGHIGLYDPTHKAAVLTDAILWKGLPDADGNIVMPPTYCHTDTYRATIQQVAALDLDVLCLSHYPLLRGADAIADFIAETARFLDRAEQAVRNALSEHSPWKTLKNILEYADTILGSFGDARDELAYPLLGHLAELSHRGYAETKLIDGIICWRRKGK